MKTLMFCILYEIIQHKQYKHNASRKGNKTDIKILPNHALA